MVEAKKNSSGARRRHRMIVGLALGLVILAGVIGLGIARAAQRGGVNYLIAIDSLSGGGGAVASGSYRQPDSAVGQESVCGLASGGGVQAYAGVVQFWPDTRNGSAVWATYE